VDRCALFVDAGYVLADGAMAVHGTRNRESVSWNYAGVLQFLGNVARERTGLPLLRCYWYEATVESRRTPEHDALADLPGVKLRLGRMRPGRREGVESEIRRDLTTLARNTAISDALVVSAEEDLAQVIADVQDLGIRVTILHITVDGNWTISRTLRQECDDIVEIGEAHLRPYVELVVGAEPAREDERLAIGSHAGRAGSNGHAAIGSLGQPALPTGSHSGPPAIYTAPVVAEYQRAAQPAPTLPGAAPPAAGQPGIGQPLPNSQSAAAAAAPAGGAGHGQPPAQPLPRRGAGVGPPRAASQGEQPGGAAPGGHAPGQQAQSPPQAPQPSQQPQPPQPAGLPQQVQLPVGLGEQPGQPPAAAVHGQHGMPGQPGPGGQPPVASPTGSPQHGFGQSNGLAGHSSGLGGQHGGFPGQPSGLGMPRSSSQSPHLAMPQPGPAQQPAGQPQQDQAQQATGRRGLPQPGVPGQPENTSQPQAAQPAGQPMAGGQPPAGQPPGPRRPAGQQAAGAHAAPAHAAPPPPPPGRPGGPQPGFPQAGVAQPVGAPGPLQAAGMPSGQGLAGPAAPAGGQAPAGQPGRPYQPGPGGQPGRYGQPEQRPGQPFAGPPPGHVEGTPAGQQAYVPQQGPHSGPQPPAQHAPVPSPLAVSLADAVQAAHGEGFNFGQTVARDAPALWLEAVLARKPRMPSDLEARLLQDSALPIDSLLHDEVRHALRRGFWDALERSRH
jgi:NYN domain-containing protein